MLSIAFRTPPPFLKVGIVLCPSFTLTPMSCFVDGLRLAADHRDDSRQKYFSWAFFKAGDSEPTSSCGLKMTVEDTLSEVSEFSCIVVCGGLLKDLDKVSQETIDSLLEAHSLGIPLIGLCTGSFILADAGLLNGYRMAIAPTVLDAFTARYDNIAAVTDQAFVVDNNICTCPGSIASIDVMSYLVSRSGDIPRAQKAQDYLLYKPDKSPFTLKAKPYQEVLDTASALTVEAIRIMEFKIAHPCSILELASSLNTTPGRLFRSFKKDVGNSPSEFWLSIRLLAARDHLVGRRQSITTIAYETGFCDAAHFCRTFKSRYGMTPQKYRCLASKEDIVTRRQS